MSRLHSPAVLLSTLCLLGGLSGCKNLNTDLGRNVYERELEDTFAHAPAGVVGTTASTHLVTFREHSFVSEPRPETTVPPSQGLRMFREAAYRLAEARANTVEGMLALREAGASEEFIATMFPTRDDWTAMYMEALNAGLQVFEGEIEVSLQNNALDDQAALIDALRAELAELQASNADWFAPTFDPHSPDFALHFMEAEACETEVCETEVCETEPCETEACETEVCETEACETEACETEECETEPCETEACETEACETEACETEACETEACETEACETEECETEACETEACETEACETEVCETEACETEACETEECELGVVEVVDAPANFEGTSVTPKAGQSWKVRYESAARAGETVRLTATCLDQAKKQASTVVLTAGFDIELSAKGKGMSKIDLPKSWKLVRLEAPGAQPLFAAFL